MAAKIISGKDVAAKIREEFITITMLMLNNVKAAKFAAGIKM